MHTSAYSRDINMFKLSPAHIHAALAHAESELPVLIAEQWPKIEPRYRVLRAQLENAPRPTQMRAAPGLV
jgi:hypothetical protein